MTNLWIVRHGETPYNSTDPKEERIRGWLDVPLDENGRKEAEDLGRQFRGKGIKRIYSSDLSRAMHTAEVIRKAIGLKAEVIPTDALRPWCLGYMEGQVVADVLPHMLYHMEHRDLEVPDGESFNGFLERLLPFVDGKLHEADRDKAPTLLVTHFRDLRAVESWMKRGMDGIDVGPNEPFVKKLKTAAVLPVERPKGRFHKLRKMLT